MDLLEQYFQLKEQVFKYFNYAEGYRVLPLDDNRQYYWLLHQEPDGSGYVCFSEKALTIQEIRLGEEIFIWNIYTQRQLKKFVYRTDKYTMIVVDTRTDTNKLLAVFSNDKQVTELSLKIVLELRKWVRMLDS